MKKLYPLLSVLLLLSFGFSQEKVNVNNLVQYGEKFFKQNDDEPFTGLVFDIDKTTGNKILNYKMVNGVRNGFYKEFYPNGNKKSNGDYKKGLMNGEWNFWSKNGQKKEERTYKDGKPLNFVSFHYDDNGQKTHEDYFENNIFVGSNFFKINGSLKDTVNIGTQEEFKKLMDDKFTGIVKVNSEEEKISGIVSLKDGEPHGRGVDRYNGQKKFEGNYKDGKRDGLGTSWYENGQKVFEGTYKDEKRDGLGTSWYENGQKRFELTFKEGKTVEVRGRWNSDGSERKEPFDYENGLLINWWE